MKIVLLLLIMILGISCCIAQEGPEVVSYTPPVFDKIELNHGDCTLIYSTLTGGMSSVQSNQSINTIVNRNQSYYPQSMPASPVVYNQPQRDFAGYSR